MWREETEWENWILLEGNINMDLKEIRFECDDSDELLRSIYWRVNTG
jgi:hypothetical protein